MEIKLRKILPADAAVLSVIAKRSFYDTFTGTCTEADMQNFQEQYFNEAKLAAEISEENNYYFFAEAEGDPVAYLQFMEDYSSLPLMKKWKALELKRLYVLKEFHGKGIAQQLMDLIISYAKEQHYEVIWLGVWEHNNRAQQFYKKYGFIASGHIHDFPIGNTPQTDIWMWKFL